MGIRDKKKGNNLNISCNDELDCQIKTSHFIMLCQQTYCKLWSFTRKCAKQTIGLGSVYFNKICTAWNIAVRKICNLPYTTHRWFLGPLMNQSHISYQLQERCIRFLHNMKTS